MKSENSEFSGKVQKINKSCKNWEVQNSDVFEKVQKYTNSPKSRTVLFCSVTSVYFTKEKSFVWLSWKSLRLEIPLFNATARLSVTVRARHQLNELAFSQSSHTQLFPGRKIQPSWPAASLALVHHLIAECRSGLSTCLLPPSAVSSFSCNKHNANCVLPVPNFPNQNR